jgi:hypothetical protein
MPVARAEVPAAVHLPPKPRDSQLSILVTGTVPILKFMEDVFEKS